MEKVKDILSIVGSIISIIFFILFSVAVVMHYHDYERSLEKVDDKNIGLKVSGPEMPIALAGYDPGCCALTPKYDLSTALAEPVMGKQKEAGVTDTVVDGYSVIPVVHGKNKFGGDHSSKQTKDLYGNTIGYKDRPGWSA